MLSAILFAYIALQSPWNGNSPGSAPQGPQTPPAEASRRPAEAFKKEVARMLAEADSSDSVRLLQIGRVALGAGLRDEAFTAFDRAIAANLEAARLDEVLQPLAADEMSALKGSVLSVRAQQHFAAFAKHAQSPSRLAYARLALRAMPRQELLVEIDHAIVAPDARTRAAATEILGSFQTDRSPEPLVRRAYLDRDPGVRRIAAAALASRNDAKITNRFMNALIEPSFVVRLHSIEALGEFRKLETVPALLKRWNQLLQAGAGAYAPQAYFFAGDQQAYVSGYNVEVAQASAIAEPVVSTLQSGVVLDVRILSTSIERQMTIEKQTIQNALAKIAGSDLGNNPAAWSKWYQTKAAPVPTK